MSKFTKEQLEYLELNVFFANDSNNDIKLITCNIGSIYGNVGLTDKESFANPLIVGVKGSVGNITGDVLGDISGDMVGHIRANMFGDINGNMSGNIEGTMNGTIHNIVYT